MLHSKMALEMRMRDALDGMEQLASMYAYGRLPEEMEILEAEEEFPLLAGVEEKPEPAQVLQFPTLQRIEPHPTENQDKKNNKIIML